MDHKHQQRVENVLRAELADMLDIIWALSDNMTIQQLADEAGLSPATVRKYYNGDWQYPRFQTVQKLAFAVGLQVAIDSDGVKVSTEDASKHAAARGSALRVAPATVAAA